MHEEIGIKEVQDLIRAEFEPQAIKWLADIKAAAPGELPKELQDQIITTLCEAFISGIETGAEDTAEIIKRNSK